MSSLAEHAEQYLQLRRAVGFKLVGEGQLLAGFVRFADQAGQSTVTTEAALAWARLPLGGSSNYLSRRLRAVRSFARYGADLELTALDGEGELGTPEVTDVHLLGAGAFAAPRPPIVSQAATREAAAIVAGSSGEVGISAECVGTGLTAAANSQHRAVAASTLKLAIIATSLSRDRVDPASPTAYPVYSRIIVLSDNDAANELLSWIGNGSTSQGTSQVNALMAHLGMRDSYLNGPYRLGGGPSLKRTSAGDLERLASDFYLAARGDGPLAAVGVTTYDARVIIGLMASEAYPGLIRDNTKHPVAHKAGWLTTVENDLVLTFGTPAGTCLIGITTEGLSFQNADAIGGEVVDEILPLLDKGATRQ